MKKLTLAAISLFAVVTVAGTLITYNRSNGFTYKGWPVAYYKTINTNGVCTGFIDELATDTGCYQRHFAKDYWALEQDISLYLLFSTTVYAFCGIINNKGHGKKA